MSNKQKNEDLRIKHTRQFLRNALLSLIFEKGFDAITVSDLTIRANINRSTFYLHYRGKGELLEQITSEILQQVNEILKVTSTPSKKVPQEILHQNLIRLVEHIQENATFYQVMLGDSMTNDFSNRMQAVLQDTYYSNIPFLRPNIDQFLIKLDIYISFMSAAHMGVIAHWLKHGLSYSPRFMADQMTRITGYGMQIMDNA